MKLSVVLPAYNEAEVLPRVIPELQRELKATGDPFEIIVVDNGSTDQTAEVLKTLQRAIPELAVVSVSPSLRYRNAFTSF